MKLVTQKTQHYWLFILLLQIFFCSFNLSHGQSNEIDRVYFRFITPEGLQRQLLLGVKEGLTEAIDYGYDAELLDADFPSECTWKIGDVQFVILGIGSIYDGLELPLEIRIGQEGISSFETESLADLEENIKINLLDKVTGVITTLEENTPIELNLPVGTYTNRFFIFFEVESLDVSDVQTNNENLFIYYDSFNNCIDIVGNREFNASNIIIYNLLGVTVYKNLKGYRKRKIKISNTFNSGVYIIRFVFNKEVLVSKKIIVK